MNFLKREPARIPETLQIKIETLLAKQFQINLSRDSRLIAEAIQFLSDHYIAHPLKSTPWHERRAQVAYLAYYLPLNYLRAQAVFAEAPLLIDQCKQLIEFGSGLGSASWSLKMTDKYFIEQSSLAQELHQELGATGKWLDQWSSNINIHAQSLALFSYALTEIQQLPLWALQCQTLVIIEPSTGQDGRKLLQLRQGLIDAGFSLHAPCVHLLSCPLLEHSKKDWCHDRIHFDQPSWFASIESHLPFKNKTLTMSYLIASKVPVAPSDLARVIGDPLVEKGKTRQMICRGTEREFLAWIHSKNKYPKTEIPRGVLLELPGDLEKKSNELRVPKSSS